MLWARSKNGLKKETSDEQNGAQYGRDKAAEKDIGP